MVRALGFLPGWMPGGSTAARNGLMHAVFPAGSDQLRHAHGSDRIRSIGCHPPAAAPRPPPKVRCDALTARCIAAALLPGRRGTGSDPGCGWHPARPSRHGCRGKHLPCPRSCAGQAAGRSQTLYHGCAHSKGRLSAWGTSFGKIAHPASTQTEEKAKDVCELLRADGADGTGGRTCTFISRFWRPLLCVKLRLQKSAGLSRLSAVIKNRRIRYGRNRCRRLPNSRQHKSRKAVSRSLRLLTVSLYHFYRGLSRVKKKCLTKRETYSIISA